MATSSSACSVVVGWSGAGQRDILLKFVLLVTHNPCSTHPHCFFLLFLVLVFSTLFGICSFFSPYSVIWLHSMIKTYKVWWIVYHYCYHFSVFISSSKCILVGLGGCYCWTYSMMLIFLICHVRAISIDVICIYSKYTSYTLCLYFQV